MYECLEGSVTAYFDLDTIYSVAFHRIIEYAENINPIYAHYTLVGKRKFILSKGGRKDLVMEENLDFCIRVV
ncbi:hypothetical protein [Desulfurococcus sp.]|uniref:hypothetical protein n=1 Tax=Desulfurococcus sp. TaxID=51678 RepID=UPI0031663354